MSHLPSSICTCLENRRPMQAACARISAASIGHVPSPGSSRLLGSSAPASGCPWHHAVDLVSFSAPLRRDGPTLRLDPPAPPVIKDELGAALSLSTFALHPLPFSLQLPEAMPQEGIQECAVPKKKRSVRRNRIRRSANMPDFVSHMGRCSECGTLRPTHVICPKCGAWHNQRPGAPS
jgi:ribosomal protein L32